MINRQKENVMDDVKSCREDVDTHTIEDLDSQNENRKTKTGRPKGLTLAESLRQKEKYLKERKKRLREEGVRRSNRLSNIYHAQLIDNTQISRNFNEAQNSDNWENWKNAENELESLNNNAWDMCERLKNAKVIKSKWVFSIKEMKIMKLNIRLGELLQGLTK